jgi:membrane fusion protein (multidrug efflux system)
MDLEAMKITINVLEKDIPLITEGKRAIVTVDAYPGKEFTGTVTRYADAVDPSTRTMAVEIDIPNPDHSLKPGMFANVVLIVKDHPDALTLPTQAIQKDDNGNYVYVVVQDSSRRATVAIGEEENGRTEILSGLTGTEFVVTTGQQFAKDGGAVLVQQ